MWVSVDILWDEFASKLSRRFGRPVYFSYLVLGTARRYGCSVMRTLWPSLGTLPYSESESVLPKRFSATSQPYCQLGS